MGDIPLFVKNLGISEDQAAIYRADCSFLPENRKIIFRSLGSMSNQKGRPGLLPMLEECSRIRRERPEQRGIIHCHSRVRRATANILWDNQRGRHRIVHQWLRNDF